MPGGSAEISTGAPVWLSTTEAYAWILEPEGTSIRSENVPTVANAWPNRFAIESWRYPYGYSPGVALPRTVPV